jgi:Lrp/AsnC family transcriptional regulator, leucine-responsive regulatory protein
MTIRRRKNIVKHRQPKLSPGLDRIDIAILDRLQDDGRITNAALAASVGIGPTACLARVRKLEIAGVIRAYAALVDPDAVGQPVTALARVQLRQHGTDELEAFKRAIGAFEQVQACWHLAGEDDFVLKIVAADLADYERFVTGQLSALENLGRVRTSICLSTVKEETRLPLPKMA